MDIKRTVFAALLATTLSALIGAAQSTELSANYSAPAVGADMWTGYMGRNGYFVPHYDDCDPAGEAFVAVAPDGKGFCMEKSERSSTTWEEARNACMQLGMRLPEAGEYKFACKRAATLGLSAMTGAMEWSSNFAVPETWGSSFSGSVAQVAGRHGCGTVGWDWVGRGDGQEVSHPYRCVR